LTSQTHGRKYVIPMSLSLQIKELLYNWLQQKVSICYLLWQVEELLNCLFVWNVWWLQF